MVDVVRFLLRFRLFWLLFAGNRSESQQRIQCGSTPEGGRALRVNARGVAQKCEPVRPCRDKKHVRQCCGFAQRRRAHVTSRAYEQWKQKTTRSRTMQHCASLT